MFVKNVPLYVHILTLSKCPPDNIGHSPRWEQWNDGSDVIYLKVLEVLSLLLCNAFSVVIMCSILNESTLYHASEPMDYSIQNSFDNL